jgi:hypothetical protein
VTDQTIPADAAYALAFSVFISLSGTPSVPQSVPYGAITWFESTAPRWVPDHGPLYMQGRSVVNDSAGFRSATDVLVRLGHGDSKEVVWTGEHFGQGIKLTLGGSSNYPAAASERATITGISHAHVWSPPA